MSVLLFVAAAVLALAAPAGVIGGLALYESGECTGEAWLRRTACCCILAGIAAVPLAYWVVSFV